MSNTIEEQTEEARRQLNDAEALMLRALAKAKALVGAQEEAVRAARLEALRHNDEALTEAQVAEIMQCSEQTIARLRKDGKIEPSLYVADYMPRYWRSQLAEIFAGCKPRGRKTRAPRKSSVISDSRFQISKKDTRVA